MDQEFARRYLNEGFSGGEKKRAEVLQLAMLRPAFAILDETDSGLDIDAVRIVSEGVNQVAGQGRRPASWSSPTTSASSTTSSPQFVHILFGGRIVENGGPELVDAARDARATTGSARSTPRPPGRGRAGADSRRRPLPVRPVEHDLEPTRPVTETKEYPRWRPI